MALDEINAKGGILGRPVELVVEDFDERRRRPAVQKARKLIEGDKVDFLLGNVNWRSTRHGAGSNEKGILHIVPGGHTDAIEPARAATGTCSASATPLQMEAERRRGGAGGIRQEVYYITP